MVLFGVVFIFYMILGGLLSGKDKMINPDPGFEPMLGPLGPRERRERPRLEKQCRLHQKSAPEINYKSHSWALCDLGPTAKR